MIPHTGLSNKRLPNFGNIPFRSPAEARLTFLGASAPNFGEWFLVLRGGSKNGFSFRTNSELGAKFRFRFWGMSRAGASEGKSEIRFPPPPPFLCFGGGSLFENPFVEFSQVLPDHIRRCETWQGSRCVADGTEDPAVLLEKDWWQSSIRAFLTDGAEGTYKNRPHKFRLAAHYWLLAVNTTLVTMIGSGLESFASKETVEAVRVGFSSSDDETFLAVMKERISSAPWPWRWLGVLMDQCSVGVTACNFMRNKLRLLVEPLFDPSHRVSNDLLLGIKISGMFPVLLAMKLCYSLNYGPWDGAKWWRTAQQSLRDALGNFKDDLKPLWISLLPYIAKDMEKDNIASDPAWGDRVFADLQSSGAVDSKGPKMALCRWLSWMHCARHWDPLWHRRLFVLLVWGLSLGYIQGDLSGTSVRCNKVKAALNTHGNSTLKVQEKASKELVVVGKNTMHSVTLIYLQGWALQRRVRALMVVGRPLERWYHEQHLQNRSDKATFAFYLKNAGSKALQPLVETFQSMSCEHNLRFLGFITQEGDLPFLDLKSGALDGHIQDESEFAEVVMNLAISIVGQRLRSLLWHLEGLPGVLPELVHDDRRVVGARLAKLKSLGSALEAAGRIAPTNSTVSEQVKQSFLLNPIPSQTMTILDGRNFEDVPEELASAISSLFALGQTVICEQANRAARNAETREQDNCRLADIRLWMLPYRQGVLSKLNRFSEVSHTEHTTQAAQMSNTPAIKKDIFSPSSVKATLPLNRVASHKETADYVTTTPQNSVRCFAHIAFWRHCVQQPTDWGLVGRAWLCQLMSPGMLVKKKNSQQVFLVLAIVSQVAVLAWKMKELRFKDQVLFAPWQDEEPYDWLVVLRPDDWEGYRLQWVGECWKLSASTASASSASSTSGASRLPHGFLARPLSARPIPLLHLAAWQGFRSMPLSVLKKLCNLVGHDVAANLDLFELLRSMLAHFLPTEDDDTYEQILSKRAKDCDDIVSPDFFSSEEVRDAFDEDDLKIIDKWRKDRNQECTKTFGEKLKKYQDEIVTKARGKTKTTTAAAKKALRGKVSEGTRLYPKVEASGALSRHEALTFLPPGSTVHKSKLDNRWRAAWSKWSRSRCWTFYGEVEAFAKCARYLWEMYEKTGGEACPFAWILKQSGESDEE